MAFEFIKLFSWSAWVARMLSNVCYANMGPYTTLIPSDPDAPDTD